ncbi:MAG: Fic family protein [Bacilli bacterium]|nr:Fic family protein [Bacilli bacterium]
MPVLPLDKMREIASEKFDLNNIYPEFVQTFVFNSLSFETDLITSQEVTSVFNGEVAEIDGRRTLLISNHINAFYFVVAMVKTNSEFNENKLKDLHEVLMDGLDVGGLYRNVDISIKGSNHTPPSHLKVYDRMKKYFDVLNDPNADVLENIAFSHVQLAKIHPFLDGNGRCARLVLNYQLMKNGLAPIIIPYQERVRYFETLEAFKVKKVIKPFLDYMLEKEMEFLNA